MIDKAVVIEMIEYRMNSLDMIINDFSSRLEFDRGYRRAKEDEHIAYQELIDDIERGFVNV